MFVFSNTLLPMLGALSIPKKVYFTPLRTTLSKLTFYTWSSFFLFVGISSSSSSSFMAFGFDSFIFMYGSWILVFFYLPFRLEVGIDLVFKVFCYLVPGAGETLVCIQRAVNRFSFFLFPISIYCLDAWRLENSEILCITEKSNLRRVKEMLLLHHDKTTDEFEYLVMKYIQFVTFSQSESTVFASRCLHKFISIHFINGWSKK